MPSSEVGKLPPVAGEIKLCKPSPPSKMRRSGQLCMWTSCRSFPRIRRPRPTAIGRWRIRASGDSQKALDYGDKALAAAPDNLGLLVFQTNVAQSAKNYPKSSSMSYGLGPVSTPPRKKPSRPLPERKPLRTRMPPPIRIPITSWRQPPSTPSPTKAMPGRA